MAAQPLASLLFEAVDDVGYVNVADIDLGDRLRPIDREWADVLGGVMKKEGQRTPITVSRLPGSSRWTLVAGGHRVVGAQIHEIVQLKAEEIGPSRNLRRQVEISENIWRKALDPIDRAAFVAEMVLLKRLQAGIEPEKAGRSVSADVRWKADKKSAADANLTIQLAFGWTDEVAAQLGFSKATIYNDLLLHRISPTFVSHLREARHPILTNATQLRSLAKLDERKQHMVVGRLIDGAKNVSEALAILDQRPARDPEQKRLDTFGGAFHRMGAVEKRAALAKLVDEMSVGMRNELRSILSEFDNA